jgi:hypothetical protein
MDHEVRPVPDGAERPAGRGIGATLGAVARPRVLFGAGIAIAAGVGVLLWLLLRGDETPTARRAPATAASISQLNAFASSVNHPIYWAGPQPAYTYELSRAKDGRVYVRYLPAGVEVGDPKPDYLTVGTYPEPHALATLRATAKKQGAQLIRLAGGGLAFQYKSRPTSVYLAYPGSNYEIEVFDPSAKRALQLVASGQVKQVGAPPATAHASRAASIEQLKALAVTLGHPIYWAGTRPGTTYELTQTKEGSVYVRYLPQGVAVGDRHGGYLTIGTYEQAGALAVLKATAAKNHVPTSKVPEGGLALVDRKHPTSVYVAYPSVDVQIEVFDPTPGRARQLVGSGQVAPIR